MPWTEDALSGELIERRIAEFLAAGESTLAWIQPAVRAHGFLPLYVGWLSVLGVRPDGTFVRWNHEADPTVVSPVTERLRRLAIAEGCKRYPELDVLWPERPASATSCEACGGSGRLPEPIICSCGGVGWIVPGEDPGEPTG